ncbi:MAG TPA: acyltransferase domain-containing protein [Aromatoleum sp.]|uniref:ACP S-malonyltransferase n=1 Tax=Aromatoleum sp. TaxID=2307007 RepID=UPI002B475E73|nr:acyltransferase domain-containing protein [Aromatoleum sp.]HJV27341.1 acyltransferase domain-containing protein [Aromatoleum sp.]
MKLAILCSGQAGQHCAMLDEVLGAPDCAELRALASDVLGQDVSAWWRGLETKQIFTNANAQFAIALYQIANWARVAPLVPQPAVVAGYSLGEVLAWHVAGALDAAQTLQLVRLRAKLMDGLAAGLESGSGEGCMLLWRGRSTPTMRAARERAISAHGVEIAIHRPGGDLVLGGPEAAIDAFVADPTVQHADLKRLQVTVPSHTRWLADAVEPFRDALAASSLRDPALPVLAGIDGRVLRRRSDALASLPAQLARPLHWDWCQETLASLGVDLALELGPGNDLAKLLEMGEAGVTARGAEEFGSAAGLREWLERHQ